MSFIAKWDPIISTNVSDGPMLPIRRRSCCTMIIKSKGWTDRIKPKVRVSCGVTPNITVEYCGERPLVGFVLFLWSFEKIRSLSVQKGHKDERLQIDDATRLTVLVYFSFFVFVVTLYYGTYGIAADGFYRLLKSLKNKNVPVHGCGVRLLF